MKSSVSSNSRRQQSRMTIAQPSLSYRMVQCQMRKDHAEYQQLLIDEKQLQIQLLEEQTKNKTMVKSFNKQKKGLDKLANQLKRIKAQNQKKQIFLKEYYSFLQKKLKSGSKPIILFAGLEKINEDLQKKLIDEKNGLEQGMQNLKTQSARLAIQNDNLTYKKSVLLQQLETTRIQKQAQKSEQQRKKAAHKKKVEQLKQLRDFYKQSIIQFKKTLQNLEQEQKGLKKVRNIEDYHKKYWLSIQNAIKKQFSYQARSMHYKQAVAEQYRLKIPDLQTELNGKKYEKQVMKEQIIQKKKKLEEFNNNLNSSMTRLSRVESQNSYL